MSSGPLRLPDLGQEVSCSLGAAESTFQRGPTHEPNPVLRDENNSRIRGKRGDVLGGRGIDPSTVLDWSVRVAVLLLPCALPRTNAVRTMDEKK